MQSLFVLIYSHSLLYAVEHIIHLDIILHGKNVMPSWKAILNDVDIAAVIAYERNALGNSTGDIIQPSAVKAARK